VVRRGFVSGHLHTCKNGQDTGTYRRERQWQSPSPEINGGAISASPNLLPVTNETERGPSCARTEVSQPSRNIE
jgi:hypothetical protein